MPIFPPVDEGEDDGLLAIGGDFSPERLLKAYASGIFPWFSEGGDIYWFSPDPRMILIPEEFKVSDSLRRVIEGGKYQVSFDNEFQHVIGGCASTERKGQDGTWISDDFIQAYTVLHQMGYAHSVEVYSGDELAGGLYGVSLGGAFFGESMFYRCRDASKVAFHALSQFCVSHRIVMIDCQVESDHLKRMGARVISRSDYLSKLKLALQAKTMQGKWTTVPAG